MKENKYDDDAFFKQYSQMERSKKGLEGAGEWHILKTMFPNNLKDKKVLDLGCGFGWHCKYVVEHGASHVIGVDLSKNMLQQAEKINPAKEITYIQSSIEEYPYEKEAFDLVISSLAFHYVQNFQQVVEKIYESIKRGGSFVFSVEHPIFTSQGTEQWYYDEKGNALHWPVDHYFTEGLRKTTFLGEEVIKYHRTLTTYMQTLLQVGFQIKEVIEPKPEKTMLETMPEMKEELRRPMMLLVSAVKPKG